MSDIRNAWTVENYTAPDGVAWRIAIFQDESAESPRDDRDTNMAELLTASRSYHSPDHDRHADPLGIMRHEWTSRMRGMYLAARADVVGWAMLDQSGRDGSLYLYAYADSAGIVEMHDGVAYITRDRWDEMMGEDYEGGVTPADVIRQEVDNYNAWARGEFCGFVVEYQQTWEAVDADGIKTGQTMETWEEPDEGGSVWGFDDQNYALNEAQSFLPEGSVKV